MNPTGRPQWIERWAPWALLLLPAAMFASSACAVAAAYSPLPYQDQWATMPLWRQALQGDLGFSDLFAQHNEHRILFPRLVFLADLEWLQGRDLLNLAVIGAVQFAAAALYVRVGTLQRPGPLVLLATATGAGLLASLQQWENLFWGFQVQFVGVFAAGAGAIYLFCAATADEARLRWPPLAGALALLVVATFSLANGLAAGLAMAATAVATRRGVRAVLAPLAATAALLALYLQGYTAVTHHAGAALVLQQPQRFVAYVLVYLGGPWTPGRVDYALLAGAAGVVATAAMAAVVIFGKVRDPGRSAMFGVVLFIGATAILTAFGRLNFGVEQALSPRYVTPAAHFWAAQALFWALTAQAQGSRWIKPVLALPILAAYALLIPFHLVSAGALAARHDQVLLGASAVANRADDPLATTHLYPDPAVLREHTPFLREHRLSLFSESAAHLVGTVRLPPRAPAGTCRGAFETLTPAPRGEAWRASGWAWDNPARRPVQRVLLVTESGAVSGLALGGARRLQQGPDRDAWIGSIPQRGRALAAYALLADGRVCLLGHRSASQALK